MTVMTKKSGFTLVRSAKVNTLGFTLIELLVTVSILAIISTIGLTAYQTVKSKARDSIRKQDLNTLATALEIHFQKKGYFIQGNGSCLDSQIFYQLKEPGIGPYISESQVPKDPAGELYCYISVNNGEGFRLFAKLENTNDPEVISCSPPTYNFSKVSEGLTVQCPP